MKTITKILVIILIISSFGLTAHTLHNNDPKNKTENKKNKKDSQKKLDHCEVPCGIYNDQVRITLIKEHITTIEKSMKSIDKLSKEKEIDYNQLIRWVNNKEEHAKKIQDIISQYFLYQRIKVKKQEDKQDYQNYLKQLTTLHQILVCAMKTKQSTDILLIKKLRKKVSAFEELYFKEHNHKH